MNQTQATEPPAAQRIIFSDDNRTLHVQALLQWLPDHLHDAPHISWTHLPSRLIGYLVNVVGENPFASSLALAAGIARGTMKDHSLQSCIVGLHQILRNIHRLYGIEQVTGLTKSIWKSYATRKPLTRGDYSYIRTYDLFTKHHFPAYLEQLNARERATFEPYILPRLPHGYCQQYVPAVPFHEASMRRRKEKSDILAPLHSLLVALVRFRYQSTQRLLSAYREALSQRKMGIVELPFPFSYEEELVTVNRNAQTVADIRLEKRPVTLRFLLWDRRTWIQNHPNDYQDALKRLAAQGIEGLAEPQFFVQCLNPAEELLWFGDLIKYRLLQRAVVENTPSEDTQQRDLLLSQLGTINGISCSGDGMLTPAHGFAVTLSQAVARTGALVFDAEALCRGALFASALATLSLTNGSRMCELLQVSADRFKIHPYVVQKDGHATAEERVMHLQLLLPKGKRTEEERKLFPISDWSWQLLREMAEALRSAHQGHIPVVRPHKKNSKIEDLSPERYLFQWGASPNGKSTTFGPDDVTSLLRFILYGLEFRTKDGEPFSVSVHLLRHVMANAASHEHAVPIEAVACALHHHYRPGTVPEATLYYSQETEDQSLVVFAEFQMNLEEWATSLLVELPDARETRRHGRGPAREF